MGLLWSRRLDRPMTRPLGDRAVGHGLMIGIMLGATALLAGILALTVLVG